MVQKMTLVYICGPTVWYIFILSCLDVLSVRRLIFYLSVTLSTGSVEESAGNNVDEKV